MMQRFIGIFALVVAAVVVTPVQAQNAVAPLSSSAAKVVEVAEKLALGRITQSGAAQLLGSPEAAATVAAAVANLKTQKGANLTSMDFAAIRAEAAKQNLTDGNAVVQLIAKATATGEGLVFTQAKTAATTDYQVDAAVGVETLTRLNLSSEAARKTLADRLGDFSRKGRQRLARLAAMVAIAMNVTPGTCSAAAQKWCAENAPAVPVMASALDIDEVAAGEAFVTAGLKGFPNETPNYIGQNERVIRGMLEALGMGKAMPKQLQSCFYTGKPDSSVVSN